MPQVCKVRCVAKAFIRNGRLATNGLKSGSVVALTGVRFTLEPDEDMAPYMRNVLLEALVGPIVASNISVGQVFDLSIAPSA